MVSYPTTLIYSYVYLCLNTNERTRLVIIYIFNMLNETSQTINCLQHQLLYLNLLSFKILFSFVVFKVKNYLLCKVCRGDDGF